MWNKEKVTSRSISLPGYPGMDDGKSWFQWQTYDNFPAPVYRYRRSSVLVGKRSMQLIEESGEKEPMQINDLAGYSPFEARARMEYDRYLSFFSGRDQSIATYLYVTAKDGSSMLLPERLDETVEILHLALNNITIYDPLTQLNQSFNQFCNEFCNINLPIVQFYETYMIQKSKLEDGESPDQFVRLNYPISTLFGRELSMQPYFFGVELYKGNETKEDNDEELEGIRQLFGNNTKAELLVNQNKTHPALTNMKSVKMIALHFRALQGPQWSKEDMKKWEMDVVHFFRNYESKQLNVYVISTTYIEQEMLRAGISLLPYLTIGFIIMCTCSVITVMVRAAYMHQNNIFKIILAVMACTMPLLACSTALAILFLCGMRFSSILCVVPFLVLSIGIDSSYLMIHEWQRVTKEIRDGEKKGETVGHRMSEVLSEVGPAILISALTNILADAVGCFTSSPEIRLLCIGNLFSMFMAYLYQMSFYSGLMSVVGKFEIAAEKSEDNITNITIQKGEVNIRKYSEVTGITRMNIGLTSQKLFAADSPLVELDSLRAEYQVPVFTMVSVFVETPGDLSQKLPLVLMNNLVKDFEHLNGSWGSVGTMYFMRDFVLFQSYLQSDHDYDDGSLVRGTTQDPDNVLRFNNDDLSAFLTWPEYDFWAGFVQLQNVSADGKEQTLKRFFFTTSYHGENLKELAERGRLLKRWRAIVDKPIYEIFHASVFYEDAIFLDLIDNMPTDTWQSVAGTLVCMAAVCFLFLRNMLTVAIATASVLSISIGILGILSWMGIELDPISMAAMIISAGFSVDIPAHVAYHYCKACEKGIYSTPQARLGNCLTSVGFPAVQAALSTTLCVCSLLFSRIYMSQVFVKTMITSVILCNLHGLVILPAMLSMVHRIKARFNRNKAYSTSAEQAVNRRMKKVKKRIAHATKMQEKSGNQLDLKMDRPPIPDFST
uniref:SSD domain-containing protein n=1 Tax=Setaria digitata TaxID=48799 RepID=A0A915Q434_9BILA